MLEETIKKNLTANLNNSGIFLELACLNNLKTRDFLSIETEIPYTLPVDDGVAPKSGTIDFLCLHKGEKDLNITFVIECKKADPSLKNWIFFRRYVDEYEGSVYFYKIKKATPGYKIVPEELNKFCDKGYYVVDNKETQSFRDLKNIIYDAAIQVCSGFKAVIRNEEKRIKQRDDFSLVDTMMYVPIIITTANLMICESNKSFNYDNADMNFKDLKYTEEKWLEYSVPLPEYLYVRELDRLNIFVINYRHMTDFFNIITTKVDRVFRIILKEVNSDN